MDSFFAEVTLFLEARRDTVDHPQYERLADKTLAFLRELKDCEVTRTALVNDDGDGHVTDAGPTDLTEQPSSFSTHQSSSVNQRFSYPPNIIPDCAICLDPVDSKSHAEAHLLCGHIFHLSCLGSAFNSSGTMQCPTCRRIQDDQPGGWR